MSTNQQDALREALESFEITGPDGDGLVWLVLHGYRTTGKAMFNLGKKERLAVQVALLFEEDRREALAASKPEPIGINGLTEAEESATASVMGIVNRKTEPQAQAVEPPIVERQFQDREGKWHSFINEAHYLNTAKDGTWPIRELITLQSHSEAMAKLEAENLRLAGEVANRNRRALEGDESKDAFNKLYDDHENLREAIAKRDAALDACVGAAEIVKRWLSVCGVETLNINPVEVLDAAIVQAQECRK